jgi:protein-tyrosine-phosphatase
MKRVLFICVENAGRSQMAEAFAKRYGAGKVEAESAGTMPSDRVNPTVVEAMKEKGIGISKAKPKLLTMKMIKEADVVVTMGCGAKDVCPAPLRKDVIEWQLEDPKEKPIEQVRRIRDAIDEKVLELIAGL